MTPMWRNNGARGVLRQRLDDLLLASTINWLALVEKGRNEIIYKYY